MNKSAVDMEESVGKVIVTSMFAMINIFFSYDTPIWSWEHH